MTTGDLVLNSNQGEKLSSEFRLFDLDTINIDEISVFSAGWLDYQNVSLQVPNFVNELSFEIKQATDTPASAIVIMRTRTPLTTNNSTVLISINWPNGRLLREYTLQFSSPVFAEDENNTVNPTPASTPVKQPNTYEVKPGDSLWKIAIRLRPSNTVSIPEFIKQIQNNNPTVFSNGNINLLQTGTILIIPDSAADDRAIVNSPDSPKPTATDGIPINARNNNKANLDATNNQTSTRLISEDRLTLITPQSDKSSSNAKLQSQDNLKPLLSFKQEDVASLTRLTRDLKENANGLDEQIETIERLLKLKSETLALLQQNFRQQATSFTERLAPQTSEPIQPLTETIRGNTAPYYWNSWAREGDTVRSFRQLKTNRTYTIYLELAGINYKNKRVNSEIISETLQNAMQRVTAQIGPVLELNTSIQADPSYFASLPVSMSPMFIKFTQVDTFDNQKSLNRNQTINPLQNQIKSDYLFESLIFSVTTGNQIGSTLLKLSVIQESQALEEIVLPIYIDN